MGLRCYLYKKTWIDSTNLSGSINLNRIKKEENKILELPYKFDLNRVHYIIEEVGYWSHADQIYRWFNDHVCSEPPMELGSMLYVDLNDLKKLKSNIEEIFNTPKGKLRDAKAKKLIPVDEFLSFEDNPYTEEYYDQLMDVLQVLNTALTEHDNHGCSDYYFEAD